MRRDTALRPQPGTYRRGSSHGDAVSRVLGCGRREVRRTGIGQRPVGDVIGFGTTQGIHRSPSPTVAAWGGFAATCPVTGDTVAGRREDQGLPSSYCHHTSTQPPFLRTLPAMGDTVAGSHLSSSPEPGRVAVTGGPASGAPTVYGDTLCITLGNAAPLSPSPLQCRGNRPNDHTPRGGEMPAIVITANSE